MAEPKTIYCPRCGHVACHYDGKQAVNPKGRCKKCKKLVVYNVESGETTLKNIPKRGQSSGLTIY